MHKKQQRTFVTTMCTQPLSNERRTRHLKAEGEVRDMTCYGWDPQVLSFAQDFPSISVLLQTCFTTMTMTSYYVLASSDTASARYKLMRAVRVWVHKKG